MSKYYPTFMYVDSSEVLNKINEQIDFRTKRLSKLETSYHRPPNTITIQVGKDTKVIEFTRSEKLRKLMDELEILFQVKDMMSQIK